MCRHPSLENGFADARCMFMNAYVLLLTACRPWLTRMIWSRQCVLAWFPSLLTTVMTAKPQWWGTFSSVVKEQTTNNALHSFLSKDPSCFSHYMFFYSLNILSFPLTFGVCFLWNNHRSPWGSGQSEHYHQGPCEVEVKDELCTLKEHTWERMWWPGNNDFI